MTWLVSEYEGYTNKKLKTERFKTREEALAFWNDRRSWNKVAGVGGKYTHYWSYPEKEKEQETPFELPFDTRIQHAVIVNGKTRILEHLKVLSPNCRICSRETDKGENQK